MVPFWYTRSMKKILFVCTGNTFRSATAEFLLKDYLKKNTITNFSVSSAGTKGNQGGVFPETIEAMNRYNIDISKHEYRVLNQNIVNDADVIISMTHVHKNFILEKFSRESYLFNELAKNESTDLKDDKEAEGEYVNIKDFIFETIDIIHDGIPEIFKKIQHL